MRKIRLSKSKQDKLIEHFVAGATARCTASLAGVNFISSAYYFCRLRELIAHHTELAATEDFSGKIEVDERYFGATEKTIEGRAPLEKFPYLDC